MRKEEALPYDEIGKRLGGIAGMTIRRWTIGDSSSQSKTSQKKAELREKITQQVVHGELTYEEAACAAEVHEQTVKTWVSRYRLEHGLGAAPRRLPPKNPDLAAWGRSYRQRRMKELGVTEENSRPTLSAGAPPSKEIQWPQRNPELPKQLPYIFEERSLRDKYSN